MPGSTLRLLTSEVFKAVLAPDDQPMFEPDPAMLFYKNRKDNKDLLLASIPALRIWSIRIETTRLTYENFKDYHKLQDFQAFFESYPSDDNSGPTDPDLGVATFFIHVIVKQTLLSTICCYFKLRKGTTLQEIIGNITVTNCEVNKLLEGLNMPPLIFGVNTDLIMYNSKIVLSDKDGYRSEPCFHYQMNFVFKWRLCNKMAKNICENQATHNVWNFEKLIDCNVTEKTTVLLSASGNEAERAELKVDGVTKGVPCDGAHMLPFPAAVYDGPAATKAQKRNRSKKPPIEAQDLQLLGRLKKGEISFSQYLDRLRYLNRTIPLPVVFHRLWNGNIVGANAMIVFEPINVMPYRISNDNEDMCFMLSVPSFHSFPMYWAWFGRILPVRKTENNLEPMTLQARFGMDLGAMAHRTHRFYRKHRRIPRRVWGLR